MRCSFWPRCEIHKSIARPDKLNEENFIEMRKLYAEGYSLAQLARSFECSTSQVVKVLNKKTKQLYTRKKKAARDAAPNTTSGSASIPSAST